jgi:hypothetical protein
MNDDENTSLYRKSITSKMKNRIISSNSKRYKHALSDDESTFNFADKENTEHIINNLSDTDYYSKKNEKNNFLSIKAQKKKYKKQNKKIYKSHTQLKEVKLTVREHRRRSTINEKSKFLMNELKNEKMVDQIITTEERQQVEHQFTGVSKSVQYCDICFSDLKNRFTLNCLHYFCKECIYTHVQTCINNISLFKNLKCPKTICLEQINQKSLERLLNPTDFSKYLYIKNKIEALTNPLYFPCPFPDCESYGLKNNIKKSSLTCLGNNHKFCTKCLKEDHPLQSCEGDKEVKQLILSKFKMIRKCPNCDCLVEKEEGCNNVTCSNVLCNYTFCWTCMNPYEKTHYINPLSQCFGLGELSQNNMILNNKCIRLSKCFLMLLLILAIIPIVILLFSFIVVVFYILTFVLDGSAIRDVKFKNKRRHSMFRFFVSALYTTMSLPFVSLGYISIAVIITFGPFYYIGKKIRTRIKQEHEITD